MDTSGWLTPEDRAYLLEAGIDPWVTEGQVWSIQGPGDLPATLGRYVHQLPALGFVWKTFGGRAFAQLRSTKLLKDEAHPEKGRGGYRFPFQIQMGLGILPSQRPLVADPAKLLVIIEGTKQSLAGASALARSPLAGEAVAVRLAGCWGWKIGKAKGGGEIDCLDQIPFEGRQVVVIPDGDVAHKAGVHKGISGLQAALRKRGAARVAVVSIPAEEGENTGLDDHLAALAPSERGAEIVRLIEAAREEVPGAEELDPDSLPAKQRLDLVHDEAAELQADRSVVSTDRIPLLRARSQELHLRLTDGELQRAIWAARRAARGAFDAMAPGEVVAGQDAEWGWEGLLLRGCLNLLLGLPKSGKTSLVMDLLARWHRGETEFLGLPLIGPCPPVLVVGVDMPEADWRRLLRQVDLIGPDNVLREPIVGLFHKGRPLTLDPEGVERIASYAEQHPGLWIIGDSYAELTRGLGVEEKDADFAEPASDLLEEVLPLGATLVLLHHMGKALSGGAASEASRGTTALPALASQLLKITGVAKGDNWADDRRRILSSDGRGGEPVQLVMERRDGVWVSHGSAEGVQREQRLKDQEGKLNDRQQDALSVVRQRWEHHGQRTAAKQAAEALGLPGANALRSIRRNLEQLERKGFLESRVVPTDDSQEREFWPVGATPQGSSGEPAAPAEEPSQPEESEGPAPDPAPPTDRQVLLLGAVRRRWEDHGQRTTAKQAVADLGLTNKAARNVLWRNLQQLSRRGLLESQVVATSKTKEEEFWPSNATPATPSEEPEPTPSEPEQGPKTAEAGVLLPNPVLPVPPGATSGEDTPQAGVSPTPATSVLSSPWEQGGDTKDRFYVFPRARGEGVGGEDTPAPPRTHVAGERTPQTAPATTGWNPPPSALEPRPQATHDRLLSLVRQRWQAGQLTSPADATEAGLPDPLPALERLTSWGHLEEAEPQRFRPSATTDSPSPPKPRRSAEPKADDPGYLDFHTAPDIEAPTPAPYEGPLPEGVVYVSTAEALPDPDLLPRILAFDLESFSARTDLWRHVGALFPFLGGRIRTAQLALPGRETYVVDVAVIGAPAIEWLRALARNPHRTLIGHNLLFDATHLIAAGIRPLCKWWDTMLASQLIGDLPSHSLEAVASNYLERPLDKTEQASQWGGALTPEQVAYAARDAQILRPLFHALCGALDRTGQREAHRLECGMVSACADGQEAGLAIDTEALAQVEAAALTSHTAKAAELHALLGISNYRSAPQLHPALEAACGAPLVEWKVDKASGERVDKPSTSSDTLRPFAALPAVALLLELRDLDQTLKETAWLRRDAAHCGGRTRPSYRILGATTGRTTTSAQLGSSSKLRSVPSDNQRFGPTAQKAGQPKPVKLPQLGFNFQGLTGRSKAALVADPGHELIDLDWSSIEVRLQASQRLYRDSGQRRILFEGLDPHCVIASQVCGREITKADPERASIGKVSNFSLSYGCGVRSLRAQLAAAQGRKVNAREAQRVYAAWHNFHPEISARMDRYGSSNVFEERSVSGRRVRLQSRAVDPATGKLRTFPLSRPNGINFPIQASGKDLLADAVGELWQRLDAFPGVRVVGLIHDEILLHCPEHCSEDVKRLALEVMTSARLKIKYLGDIPLEADASIGPSWGEVH
ncbi:hypothetical protein EVJ50_03885 [Synechococcus sp. RSCCF101]|uniref:DNA polymerase n=1 Tax=Synechococcus sp. RSCCF101 TaxID=2511069 RepID=UPI00124453E2|nr:DNA polymerase [Synechococcus sp. RSCCF101]QEY31517.1 hypothetical protein EVJ50_03885 [Synechococcus sp. RSCCF101]